MTELDEVWTQMLNAAAAKASADGRHDVAEYLSLKAANDTIRIAGLKWLFDSVTEIASEFHLSRPGIVIERTEPHNFTHKGANLVGSQVRITQGVRCLTVEAGWTRTPADGFMRGGSLAAAKLTHFGIPKANIELSLTLTDSVPVWLISTEGYERRAFDSNELRSHFQVFLGD